MWKEHLKSSSSRQELVPNSQSILTRCTFEEFENSRHALTQIQIGVKTELKSDRWHTHLHTHGLLVTYTVIGAQEVMRQRHFVEKKSKMPRKSPRSIPTRWHRSKLAWRCFQETWLPYIYIIYLCRVRIRSRRDRQNYLKAKAANQQLLQDQTYESWPKVTSSRTNTRPLRKTGSNPFIEESKDY